MSPQDAYTTNVWMLGLMAWREARSEGATAMLAVAYIPMTRAEHGGWWGGSLLSCITRAYQFSSIGTPRDAQLTTWPTLTDPTWDEALQCAKAAIAKSRPNPAPNADSYFDDSIVPPPWAIPDNFIAKIGKLNFYQTVR